MDDSDIAIYVTPDAVFPGTTSDETSLHAALKQLSRDDALFACARLSAVVSGFAPGRSNHERQQQAVSLLCSEEQLRALARYAVRHGGPERVTVFFRGQLLELARRIALDCENLPGDGETFRDPTVRSAFLRAALIASELWQQRIFGPDGLRPRMNANSQLQEALGAFRKNVEEGNQAAHPGFTTSRGWLLFTRYLPSHLPEFAALFESSTGLSLRQYIISAFALLQRTFSDQPESGRIIDTQYVRGDTPFREVFDRFMRLQSQTPEEWAESLRTAPSGHGYRSLRERPIFSFARGRSIIFDPTFYIDNLATGPLFQVRSAGVSMNRVFGAFGLAFEDYAKDLLRRRFPTTAAILHQRLRCGVKGISDAGDEFEVDAVLNDVTAAVVFEMKAAWIREETVLASDPEVFLSELRSKYGYVADSGERAKGAAQLARSVGALIRREWTGPDREYAQVRSVYPVLIVFDTRMGAPGSGHFLEQEFRALLGPVRDGSIVHPLIIMSIADLEYLISGVEQLSVTDFLRAYSVADRERMSSVHNFIARSEFLSQVRPSAILEELTEEFMQAAREELLPQPNATVPDSSTGIRVRPDRG